MSPKLGLLQALWMVITKFHYFSSEIRILCHDLYGACYIAAKLIFLLSEVLKMVHYDRKASESGSWSDSDF